jgi:hypothetical protein
MTVENCIQIIPSRSTTECCDHSCLLIGKCAMYLSLPEIRDGEPGAYIAAVAEGIKRKRPRRLSYRLFRRPKQPV